ncbi:EH DOMAIN-CONTAINING PROTEIN 2 [Salix koriyanagi]|uniref:EH DOMAIN-CONTAINING PROTEIN 2 n=1 Tax=Salix koriyanagi TaxID=2511006 RepID=A0A9Q0P821_9ROSI|nr:EH DOMAIN-CONTAINING PROTEIN 2 [Salix koriyanagi]
MNLGPYSTRKTLTSIKHLLRCNYPAAHIGPEPTTDRFVVGMLGSDERNLPGNIVATQAEKEQINDLVMDMVDIPKKACDRRFNEFVKGLRLNNALSIILKMQGVKLCAFVGPPGTRSWENISSFVNRCCLWQKTCPHILGGIKDKADIRGANPMGIPSRERGYVRRPSYDESIVFESRFWEHGSSRNERI